MRWWKHFHTYHNSIKHFVFGSFCRKGLVGEGVEREVKVQVIVKNSILKKSHWNHWPNMLPVLHCNLVQSYKSSAAFLDHFPFSSVYLFQRFLPSFKDNCKHCAFLFYSYLCYGNQSINKNIDMIWNFSCHCETTGRSVWIVQHRFGGMWDEA